MKSFGVRLAAGAGTLLVVAYAIALAQKDTQAVSDSWNAETTTATDPAVPITSGESADWLQQPDSQLNHEQTALLFGQPSGTIQQVEHQETVVSGPAIANPGFQSPTSTTPDGDQTTILATPDFPNPAGAQIAAPFAFSAGESVLTSEAPASIAAGSQAAMALPNFAAGHPIDTLSAADLPVTFETPTSTTAVGLEETRGNAASGIAAYPNDPTSAATEIPAQTAELGSASSGLGFPNSTVESGDVFQTPEFNTEPVPQTFANNAPGTSNVLRGGEPSHNLLRGAAPAATVAAIAGSIASPNQLGFNGGVQRLETDATVNPLMVSGGTVMVAPQATAQSGTPANYPSNQLSPNLGGPSLGNEPSATGYSNPSGNPLESTPNSREYGNPPVGMAPPNSAIGMNPNATIDAPGERRLEGEQTPSVIIQKRAPAEVKVGKPATFVIHVRNVGAVEALDVEVHDRVPAGMRLVDASPTPQMQGNMLMWQLGTMPAGDERTITMQLVPEQEGELGSVARVSFEAAASVRTIATRPVLNIEQQAPENVLIGQQLEIGLTISNSGSGKATNVEIWEDVPEGLSHPEGPQLKHNLGTLEPGAVLTDSLFLKAEKVGVIRNTIQLVGDDGLKAEHTVSVQVIAPDLQLSLQGPSRRFLERQANYQLNVANAGTADATNVEISVQLSRGFTFVSTDYEGQYDPNRHAVSWSLANLPAGASGNVPLTLLPVETGEQIIKINANADLDIAAHSERKMTVEGFADLGFSITNPKGPIEIGAETTYEIIVDNSGSKPDTNVRVQLQLPAGLELISVDGDAGTDGNGLVAFQPKPQLAPGQEFKYRLRVRGISAGTHIVKAVVVSDQSSVPVSKEDSTKVYDDH